MLCILVAAVITVNGCSSDSAPAIDNTDSSTGATNDSSNNAESTAETPPLIYSNDHKQKLTATVTWNGGYFTVTNHDRFDWKYLMFDINSPFQGGEYILHGPNVPYAPDTAGLDDNLTVIHAGETIRLPANSFETVRFDDDPPGSYFSRHKRVYQFSINCSVPSKNSFFDKGLWTGGKPNASGKIQFDAPHFDSLAN